MNLPNNGRIAIIDDQFKHALPLIQVFSKKQLPFTYFSGEQEYLPSPEDNYNDIRILFLDINLIDDREHDRKVLKSRLVPVLKRVISVNNYPYVIIYWSRHEEHRFLIENEIFKEDLKDRQPIAFVSAVKANYFSHDGTQSADFEKNMALLFQKIISELNKFQSYSYLLNWENIIHKSTDQTLQEIFSPTNGEDWSQAADYLMTKLGQSYSGKSYRTQEAEEQIRSSFNALTFVAFDTIEKNINSSNFSESGKIKLPHKASDQKTLHAVNTKLLFSQDTEPLEFPGSIIEDLDPSTEGIFREILSSLFLRNEVEKMMTEEEKKDISKTKLKNILKNKCSEYRKEIRESWKKIYLTATPLCDYAQSKNENNRCIKGIIIEAKFKNLIDNRSEAIFISPVFSIEDKSYILILHMRHFFTSKKGVKIKNLKPILRARQQLLAEIQSLLARHINRQGILFLEDNN